MFIPKEKVHFLIVNCLHLEAVAEDLTERFFTRLLILFRLIPQAIPVLAFEMNSFARAFTAAISEEY